MKFAHQKLSNKYTEVTPTTGVVLISAEILDSFGTLRSFWKWDQGMDINPENETSYTTQYQEAFLKYVETEYSAEHQRLPITTPESVPHNNLFSPATVSRSGQSCYDPSDFFSDAEQFLMSENVAGTTAGWSNHAVRFLTAARLYLSSPHELRQKWGQINPNHNHYHSDPTEICSTLWILDIADWWRQQEETHSKYDNLSNVACDIFFIIPHGSRVEASCSLGRDVIGRRQSKTTGETLCENVLVRVFAQTNNGLLAGDDPALDTPNTDNDLEMKREAEPKILHRMAKVDGLLEMWQGSQNLCLT